MKKLFLTKELDSINLVMSYLGYKEEDKKLIYKERYALVKYNKDNVNEEDKKHTIRSHSPFLFIVIALVIAFIFATVFLVLNFTYLDKTNKLTYFFILMLPAFLFVLIATILSLRRYFNSIHNLEAVSYIILKVKKGDK